MMLIDARRRAIRGNSSRAASFLRICHAVSYNFRHFSRVLEPVEAMRVSYSGTALDDKVRTSIRVSHLTIAERFP
jgi:hypothetical protein